MRLRPFLIVAGTLLVGAVLLVGLSPLIVANGLRIWAQRVAQREGLRLEVEEIEAPLLSPVVVRNLRVKSDSAGPFQIECTAPRVELGFSLAGIFAGSKRPLRHLQVDGLTLVIRADRSISQPARPISWSILANLQADDFKFTGTAIHVEDGPTIIDLRDGTLTGSELEAGSITAREITIAAPWFQKTFSNLRG